MRLANWELKIEPSPKYIEYLTKITSSDPHFGEAYTKLAAVYKYLGHYREAAVRALKALEHGYAQYIAKGTLTEAYERLGRYSYSYH